MHDFLASLYLLWVSITGAPLQPPDLTQLPPETEEVRLLKQTKKHEASKPDTSKPITDPVVCQLKIDGYAGRRTIVALVTATQEPRSGSYTLEIKKIGQNEAVSRQHGDFELTSGETKHLAKISITVGANEALTGRLLVNVDGNETVCQTL